MQHRVSNGRRCARRDVPDVREIRPNDRLPKCGQSPLTIAEGELSAEEQTVLCGTLALLQIGRYTGGGADLQEIPYA